MFTFTLSFILNIPIKVSLTVKNQLIKINFFLNFKNKIFLN